MNEKKYFYANGEEKLGPYTIDELRELHIAPNTLIWFEGLAEWQKAGTLAELNPLFATPIENPQPEQEMAPKTWLLQAILTTLFCCLPFGIVAIVFAARVNSTYQSGDYENAKRYSALARKWVRIALFTGIIAIIINVIYTLTRDNGLLY